MGMGSLFSCFSPSKTRKQPRSPRRFMSGDSSPPPPPPPPFFSFSTNGRSRSRVERNGGEVDSQDMLIQDKVLQAATALILGDGGAGAGAFSFDRSVSVRQPPTAAGSRKKPALPRSSSTRPRAAGDPILSPHLLLNQDVLIDGLETKHFVLVHGGGFGAWCWYKTIALLKDAGFRVNAIDLTGAGVHAFDTNSITSLSQYVEPLTTFLENLGNEDKVILVGHDFGGACISYAMEAFPSKVAKAVFVSAAMLMDGQSTLDMFTNQIGPDDLMRRAQVFQYANGKVHPPSAIDFDKSLLEDLLFNLSPGKDVALASVSMRPMPLTPVLEKLSLSDMKYGSIQRFYIQTTDDNAIPLSLQQSMCKSNPPKRVFQIKGSDHSPFFSKPQALHRHLLEIAKIPAGH